MRHLDGITATQAGRVRALLAFQPLEVALPAAGAVDLAQERGDPDALLHVVPDVEIEQVAIDLVEAAGEDLDRLGRLQAGDDVNNRPEHADGFAGAGLARCRGRLEDAAQARRLSRQDRHRLTVTAEAATVD